MRRGTCPTCGEPINGRTPVDLVEAILSHSCRPVDAVPPRDPAPAEHDWRIR